MEWILFDFGGVLAEEGFREGLKAIARRNALDPDTVFAVGKELVYSIGYVTGKTTEEIFWQSMRQRLGIDEDDRTLRKTILDRFTLRKWMFEIVRRLKNSGQPLAILSDQVNWLDELDRATPFFHHFDHVFNSFHLGKSKKDPSLFSDIVTRLDTRSERTLFIDDSPGNVQRAKDQGLSSILMEDRTSFEAALVRFCPGLEASASDQALR